MQVGTTKDQGLYNKPSAAVHSVALVAGTLPQYNYSSCPRVQTETEARQTSCPRKMRPGFVSGLLSSGAEMSKLFSAASLCLLALGAEINSCT